MKLFSEMKGLKNRQNLKKNDLFLSQFINQQELYFCIKNFILSKIQNVYDMKNFTILLLFLLFTNTLLFAQFPLDVILTVTDENMDQTEVKVKGSYDGWADSQPANDDGINGDATAGDFIFSITVSIAAAGDYEWGAEDGEGVWLIVGPNLMFSVDESGTVTGQTNYTIPLVGEVFPVILTVNDVNGNITSLDFKGSYGGWAADAANDDGIDGDAVAGDNIWTLTTMAEEGSYEWGAERTDCDNPAWIIQGPNLSFSVDAQGMSSGQTNYDVPAAGDKYNVTFRVDMSNEIVESSGLFVSGSFLECAWDKNDWPLTETATAGLWETTIEVSSGTYEYKFFNGDLDDAGAEGLDEVFINGNCGVTNNMGGSNRTLDLSNLDSDLVLTAVIFNSCDESSLVNVNELESAISLKIFPNPTRDIALIQFDNSSNELYNLQITDITGKLIKTIRNFSGNQISVDTDELGPGLFLATLENQQGVSVTKKIIVQ